MSKITEKIQNFYQKYPYPNKEISSIEELYLNGKWISKLVNVDPYKFQKNEKILEAGCGTGEFSCCFALGNGSVTGIDISKTSLKKARELSEKLNLKVKFLQEDIFNLPFEVESFDYIFSIGVLHHTKDPKKGFNILCDLLKPNGHICIGLYNKWGRFPTKFRNIVLDLLIGKDSNKRIEFAKKHFIKLKEFDEKQTIWVADKYANPHEKTYSIENVLKWFSKNNITPMNIIPKIDSVKNESISDSINLKKIQFNWLLKEKNFFLMSGKKNV